jgi:hypothetical protein
MPIVVKNGYDLDVDSNIIVSTTVHIYIKCNAYIIPFSKKHMKNLK